MSHPPLRWRPAVPDGAPDPFADGEPAASDWYLTVDDIDGATLHLVASPWPSVDPTGALAFPGLDPEPTEDEASPLADPSDSEVILTTSEFHRFVREERARRGQAAPDRPLRVGDTFWFRGDLPEPGSGFEGELADVTFAAREEAKAALAWACTGAVPGRRLDVERQARPADALEEASADEPEEEEQQPARPSLPGSIAGPSV